jgi:predicted Zn-ribbon and HTH transcriptional regulator
MYTDLFLALLNRKNTREHPILSAMLYAFCPTAAHWWLAGADPTPPFDPVWKSLEDLSSGKTLHEFLIKYDFGNLIEEVRAYIREVDEYRKQHSNLCAPELMPLFRGGKLSVSRRYGSQNAIDHLGGDWRNLNIYVRTWAFLSQDWRIAMLIEPDSGYQLTGEKVCLTLPGVRLPVQFDTWIWKVPVGHVTETKIGALVSKGEQDQLRFSMLSRCTTLGKQPWSNTPAIFALDRDTGNAKHFDQVLANRDLEKLVESLSNLAKKGPHPPLNALRQPSVCKQCGYQQLCFTRNQISQHALKDL